ncbi:MAG TPA: Do family serine endopeptidase [Burkholderiaceae bacterium]|jgi:serine protease Do|nr:Do family serine endopeptidase [Burkholderiaceae bacterium]
MKLKVMHTLPATAAAVGVLIVGLGAYTPTRAGILDFLQHKNEQTVQADARRSAEQPEDTSAAPAPTPGQAPNYRAIVHQWGPAVVGVTVEGTRKIGADSSSGFDWNDDPFFQFFRGLPGGGLRIPHSAEQPFHGQGSGFIISRDGLILTNAHVVRDAQEVTVKLADRRELKAKVLGADPATDIAVLRVDATGLPTVKFGDPKALQVGDYVLAIGAPFGFDQSATAGIVSAKGRSLPGDAYVPFIQTDAAVNPGNSGGPLFDAAGNVVGINAQIYSQTGGYQGLSFAIPIDVALHVKDQITATGHASHARLGVMVQDLNQALAESFGLSRPDGALVASVDPDSPAATAGLKPGDVITQVNGTPIERAGDLSNRIGMDSPGSRATLKVWRDHSTREIEVKLAEADSGSVPLASSGSDQHGQLGLVLRPLTRQERSERSVDHGLVVEDVGGPAARAGIQPGDVLLGIDGQPARSVDQVRSVVRGHPKSVALLIDRDGQKIFVPVKLG